MVSGLGVSGKKVSGWGFGFWLRDGLMAWAGPGLGWVGLCGLIVPVSTMPLPGMWVQVRCTTTLFWWPKLRMDVGDFIILLHRCQAIKPTNQKLAGLLNPLPVLVAD